MLTLDWLETFWSAPAMAANVVVFLNLLGALVLGLVVGYERSYHGRAAGMRTYGMVCMASAALTVFSGYPEFWFGGHGPHPAAVDPTRVVQGVVTGIGFLGAGVIMKEGLSISGLTTAASIWASSAIGVLVGIGFYGAAILLTALSAVLMMWGSRLESKLPSRHAIGIHLRFVAKQVPQETVVAQWLAECGHELARESISVTVDHGQAQWRCVAVAVSRQSAWPLPELARHLTERREVEFAHLAHARN